MLTGPRGSGTGKLSYIIHDPPAARVREFSVSFHNILTMPYRSGTVAEQRGISLTLSAFLSFPLPLSVIKHRSSCQHLIRASAHIKITSSFSIVMCVLVYIFCACNVHNLKVPTSLTCQLSFLFVINL